jgi:magnesium transporter
MQKVSSRHVTWMDIENPTEEEIASLARKHPIHPIVVQELLSVTFRPKLEDYGDHLYLVLHFPIFDPKTNITLSREIDFIIFPYSVVTVHYEPIPQLDDFQTLLGEHERIRERNFGDSASQLLYHIIKQLFMASEKELDAIGRDIKIVEEDVFGNREQKALTEIARIRRDLLNFQKALKPQRTVLSSLADHGKHFFNLPSIIPYFNDIQGEYMHVWNSVEDYRETLDVLYETNLSLLTSTTNDVMKFLTATASILLPISLIASIFGMNSPSMPFVNEPNGFWIVIGIMLAALVILVGIFKSRKWL